MISTTLVLLAHYKERDEQNIPLIIDAYMRGNVLPDKIIVFIDNDQITFPLPEFVQVIYSNKPVSVMARLYASTFAETSHVVLVDSDLMPQKDTLEKMVQFAMSHPNSVLGHEGVTLKENTNPYTSTMTTTVDKPTECDVLIRSWFVPMRVFTSGLRLFYEMQLPNKYADDLIICLANRIDGYKNYILPIKFTELKTGNVGQCLSGEHYIYRDQVCSLLMQKYH